MNQFAAWPVFRCAVVFSQPVRSLSARHAASDFINGTGVENGKPAQDPIIGQSELLHWVDGIDFVRWRRVERWGCQLLDTSRKPSSQPKGQCARGNRASVTKPTAYRTAFRNPDRIAARASDTPAG